MNNPTIAGFILATLLTFLASCSGSGGSSNTAPIASAIHNNPSNVLVGDVVFLDGSASNDADGDPLSFAWTLAAPPGSAASLSDATIVNPDFTADVPGLYVASLIVNDGRADSTSDDVSVNVLVPPPVVSITTPENLSVVTTSPVTVEGTVDDITAMITVNGADVINNNGNFSAPVTLQLGSNDISVIATNGTGEGSSGVEVIYNDGLAPAITILIPKRVLPEGSIKTDFLVGREFEIIEPLGPASINVSGAVKVNTSALLPNNNKPTVSVNGIPATVELGIFNSECNILNPFQCWRFTATISLEKGQRTITATATDVVDRVSMASVGGIVDYCRKFGLNPGDGGMNALIGNNQNNRCHEIDGCSGGNDPASDASRNEPMPGAKENRVPIRFGSGTIPPSEFFVHGLYPQELLGCNIHDTCYQTCELGQDPRGKWDECNRNQYDDHKDKCRQAYPGGACPTPLLRSKCNLWHFEKATCFTLAKIYFDAVSTVSIPFDKESGWEAYMRRQNDYCAVQFVPLP